MYARDFDEEQATLFLEELLETVQFGSHPVAGESFEPATVA
jgi:hypothetical protein